MTIEQALESGLEDTIENIATQLSEEEKLGKITKVYPRVIAEDGYMHSCNVLLLSEDKELANVEISKQATSTVNIPRKDDICIISYHELKQNNPLITDIVNIYPPLEEDKPDDLGDSKRYLPYPALYNDYRINKWGEAEFAITRDLGENKKSVDDKERTDAERDEDDVVIKLGKRSNIFESSDAVNFADFDMGLEMDLGKDKITLTDDAEKSRIQMRKNDNDERIVEVLNDDTEDSGLRINMDTGAFKIGKGDYGIESDGSGNFDWYFNELKMHESDGETMSW